MGVCSSGTDFCEIESREGGFRPGPMALIIDILAEKRLGYSPKECSAMGFISESGIKRRKKCTTRRIMKLPRGDEKGTLYHRVYAFILGLIALETASRKETAVVPVFFRNCDGTASSPRNEWELKRRSIKTGFEQAKCPAGVAMVPKPKSECWILCAIQNTPYQDCAKFEALSGNDASPENAPKKLLEKILEKSPNATVQAELFESGLVDLDRIDMPSFNAFRTDFYHALQTAQR